MRHIYTLLICLLGIQLFAANTTSLSPSYASELVVNPPDSDGDGIDDDVDLDDDNDGILDSEEAALSAANSYSGGQTGNLSDGIASTDYSLVANSVIGYNGVTYTTTSSGIEIEGQSLTNASGVVDLLDYTINFTNTTPGFIPVVRLYQVDATTSGTMEASDFKVSWLGGGSAQYFDEAAENAALYTNTPPSGFDLANRQIQGLETQGFIDNNDSVRIYALQNSTSEWYIQYPAGATAIRIVKRTLSDGTSLTEGIDNQYPSLGYSDPTKSGESFKEWIAFKVYFIPDTDLDGIADYLDTDSDNDGCPDTDEAYGASGTDSNNDGTYGGLVAAYDPLDPTNPGGVNAEGLVNAAGITGSVYNTTPTANFQTATTATVDATALVDQLIVSGATTFAITSATATSTQTFTGTAPATTPDYTTAQTDVSSGLSYQWQLFGEDLTNTGVYSNTSATGATPPALTISDVKGLNGNTYTLVVKHSDNTCTQIENSATLSEDSDNDGIGNTADLDDDNDGILDDVECNGTFVPATFTFTNDGNLDGEESGSITTSNGATGTWNISHTFANGGSFVTGGLSTNDELFFQYNGSGTWDLTSATFSTVISGADNLQFSLYGYKDADAIAPSKGLESRFGQYTITWVGGTGDATIFDPANQTFNADNTPMANGASFTQRAPYKNNKLQWFVVFPKGATEFTINAIGGSSLEAFRFSAVELLCQDFDGDGIPDYQDLDSDNDGISDNIEAVCTGCSTAGAYSGIDLNMNGLDDAFENLTAGNESGGTIMGITPVSTADGDVDYLDIDTDGDGAFDWSEAFDMNMDGEAKDDFIAIAAAYEIANSTPGDYTTADSDGDGIPDWLDNLNGPGITKGIHPPFLNHASAFWIDTNGDGIADLVDATINGSSPAGLPDTDATNDADWRDINNAAPLPITLLSFNAVANGCDINVYWSATDALNFDYFEVEKATSTDDFIAFAKTAASNDATEAIPSYDAVLTNAQGLTYLRLKMVDLDGTVEYSETIVATTDCNTTAPSMYPNPVIVGTNVIIENEMSGNVILSDVTGRTIQQMDVTPGEVCILNTANLQPGVYFITNANGLAQQLFVR